MQQQAGVRLLAGRQELKASKSAGSAIMAQRCKGESIHGIGTARCTSTAQRLVLTRPHCARCLLAVSGSNVHLDSWRYPT